VRARSVAVDAAAIALVAIARQPVEIVVELNGRNESGRALWDRLSLRLTNLMHSVAIVSRRVRSDRDKSKTHCKRPRREFHFDLHSDQRLAELEFIEWRPMTTAQTDSL